MEYTRHGFSTATSNIFLHGGRVGFMFALFTVIFAGFCLISCNALFEDQVGVIDW